MPIYEYYCSLCGSEREELQSFGAEAPLCCGEPMTRLFASNPLVFWGKMTPTLRKFGDKSVPYTRRIEHEKRYRDKRAAI